MRKKRLDDPDIWTPAENTDELKSKQSRYLDKKLHSVKRALKVWSALHLLLGIGAFSVLATTTLWTNPYLPKSSIYWYGHVKTWQCEFWKFEHVMLQIRLFMYLIPSVLGMFVGSTTGKIYGNVRFTWLACMFVIIPGAVLNAWNVWKWGTCKKWAVCVQAVALPGYRPKDWFFLFLASDFWFMLISPPVVMLIAWRCKEVYLNWHIDSVSRRGVVR